MLVMPQAEKDMTRLMQVRIGLLSLNILLSGAMHHHAFLMEDQRPAGIVHLTDKLSLLSPFRASAWSYPA